jgi:hypothetical protein
MLSSFDGLINELNLFNLHQKGRITRCAGGRL